MCVMSIPCLFSLLLPSSSSRRIRRESPVSWCWWKRGERFLCPFISRLSLVFPLVVLYPMTFPCWCSLWTHPAFLTLLSFLSLDLFIALYFCKKNSWPLPNPLPFKQNVTDLFQSFVFPFFGLKSDRFSFLFLFLSFSFLLFGSHSSHLPVKQARCRRLNLFPSFFHSEWRGFCQETVDSSSRLPFLSSSPTLNLSRILCLSLNLWR